MGRKLNAFVLDTQICYGISLRVGEVKPSNLCALWDSIPAPPPLSHANFDHFVALSYVHINVIEIAIRFGSIVHVVSKLYGHSKITMR